MVRSPRVVRLFILIAAAGLVPAIAVAQTVLPPPAASTVQTSPGEPLQLSLQDAVTPLLLDALVFGAGSVVLTAS